MEGWEGANLRSRSRGELTRRILKGRDRVGSRVANCGAVRARVGESAGWKT